MTSSTNGMFLVNASMSTSNSHVSPVIDGQRTSIILTSNRVNDVIKDNINGSSVKPGDINQMINKINKIYRNKNYRLNIIENSNKLINKFDRKNIIGKVINVYNNL